MVVCKRPQGQIQSDLKMNLINHSKLERNWCQLWLNQATKMNMLHYHAIFLYLLPTIVKRRMLRKSRISVIPNIRYTFNSLLLVKIKSRHRLQEGEDFCILVMSMVKKVRGWTSSPRRAVWGWRRRWEAGKTGSEKWHNIDISKDLLLSIDIFVMFTLWLKLLSPSAERREFFSPTCGKMWDSAVSWTTVFLISGGTVWPLSEGGPLTD